MTDKIMAKDVQVAHIYQARCRLCEWSGELLDSYSSANADREAHLADHRAGRVTPR